MPGFNRSPLFLFTLFILLTWRLGWTKEEQKQPLEQLRIVSFGHSFLEKRPHYLYLPSHLDPKRDYWLVCYIHGAHGCGRADVVSLEDFVKRGDCLGMAPSLDHGFQLLNSGTDKELLQVIDELRKHYRLHRTFFLYGHSAGAQFVHRFTMRYPHLVLGSAASSAGTWATGGIYHQLNPALREKPIGICCGREDQQRVGARIEKLFLEQSNTPFISSVRSQDPGWSRVEWFRQFEKQLEEGNYFFKSKEIWGLGHQLRNNDQEELALEAFLLGTSGMLPQEREAYDHALALHQLKGANLAGISKELEKLDHYLASRSSIVLFNKLSKHGWKLGSSALERCRQSSQAFIEEEKARLKLDTSFSYFSLQF